MNQLIFLSTFIGFFHTKAPATYQSFIQQGYNITFIHDSPLDKPGETYLVFELDNIQYGFVSSTVCPVAFIFDPEVKVTMLANSVNEQNINEFSSIFQWTMFCQDAKEPTSTSRLQITNYSLANYDSLTPLIHNPAYANYNCTLFNLQFNGKAPGANNCCCGTNDEEDDIEGISAGGLAAAIIVPIIVIIIVVIVVAFKVKRKSSKYQVEATNENEQQ